MSRELWAHNATSLAGLIAQRAVSSTEVVRAHLERIETVNPLLNAVVVVCAAEALADARHADDCLARGEVVGPLHGVPVTIKENIDVAGTATTDGLVSRARDVAARDAPAVERLRGAGAIVLGRTNLPDMGLRISTDSSLHGLTRNPWHRGRTAGGSSGGEAAAIAAGMSPLGLGNDIGGSLRNPAHCCGIAAIKPTPGRVATESPTSTLAAQLMAATGPLARGIDDLALALSLLCGPHPRDPTALPLPPPEGAGPARRIALLAEPPGGTTDPGVAAVVRAAGRHLEHGGYVVEELEPPGFVEATDIWRALMAAEIRAAHLVDSPEIGDAGRQVLAALLEREHEIDLARYLSLFVRRRALQRSWFALFATHPVIVLPVWTAVAFPHGFDADGPQHAAAATDLSRPVVPANLLGLPAVSVPGGLAQGMPVGVQCVAAPYREADALAAAAAIEAAVGALTPVDPFVTVDSPRP